MYVIAETVQLAGIGTSELDTRAALDENMSCNGFLSLAGVLTAMIVTLTTLMQAMRHKPRTASAVAELVFFLAADCVWL